MLIHRERGYTLVEITIVIAIIMILMVTIGLHFRGVDHGLQTAYLMESHFTQLRDRAMTRNKTLELIIDFEEHHYYGRSEEGRPFPEVVDIPGNVFIELIPGEEEEGNILGINPDRIAIVFFPDGTCALYDYHDREEQASPLHTFIFHFMYGNNENWMKVDGSGALWEISSQPFSDEEVIYETS